MLKVCKFGGSSLSDASQFEKVKNIVKSDDLRRVIVVSALGKRDSKDYKISETTKPNTINVSVFNEELLRTPFLKKKDY